MGLALGAALGTAAAFAVWSPGGCTTTASSANGCGANVPEPVYFLVLPAAGAGLGYLIGRTAGENFAGPADETADRGLNWWQGGLIGSAIGSLAGIFLADRLDDGSNCPDCTPISEGEFRAAGAGGALVGFLIGARVAAH